MRRVLPLLLAGSAREVLSIFSGDGTMSLWASGFWWQGTGGSGDWWLCWVMVNQGPCLQSLWPGPLHSSPLLPFFPVCRQLSLGTSASWQPGSWQLPPPPPPDTPPAYQRTILIRGQGNRPADYFSTAGSLGEGTEPIPRVVWQKVARQGRGETPGKLPRNGFKLG